MSFLDKYAPMLLSILRIVAGLLFLEHGTSKLLHFPYNATFDHLTPMMMAAGAIEVVGGALIVLGLFSRIAAFIASGEMAVAYWMVHVAGGGLLPANNGGGEAILYCFVFLYIAAAGPGPWAVNQR
ncbi:MAG TPA: DoxX family protein [Rhizomicrobium sp.]